MNDAIAHGARAAAARLEDENGPGLATKVEQALHTQGGPPRPDQYVDPVAIGGLIVAIATLAWQAYTDLKAKAARPSAEVVTRAVRVQLQSAGTQSVMPPDRIVEVVVIETITHADQHN